MKFQFLWGLSDGVGTTPELRLKEKNFLKSYKLLYLWPGLACQSLWPVGQLVRISVLQNIQVLAGWGQKTKKKGGGRCDFEI